MSPFIKELWCLPPPPDPDQGLGYRLRGWSGLLSSQWPRRVCGQCGQCRLLHPPASSDHTQERPGNQEPVGAPVWPWGHLKQHAGVFALGSEASKTFAEGLALNMHVREVFCLQRKWIVFSWQMAAFCLKWAVSVKSVSQKDNCCKRFILRVHYIKAPFDAFVNGHQHQQGSHRVAAIFVKPLHVLLLLEQPGWGHRPLGHQGGAGGD